MTLSCIMTSATGFHFDSNENPILQAARTSPSPGSARWIPLSDFNANRAFFYPGDYTLLLKIKHIDGAIDAMHFLYKQYQALSIIDTISELREVKDPIALSAFLRIVDPPAFYRHNLLLAAEHIRRNGIIYTEEDIFNPVTITGDTLPAHMPIELKKFHVVYSEPIPSKEEPSEIITAAMLLSVHDHELIRNRDLSAAKAYVYRKFYDWVAKTKGLPARDWEQFYRDSRLLY